MAETCQWTIYKNVGVAFGPQCSDNGSFKISSDTLELWKFCPLCGKPIERKTTANDAPAAGEPK